MKKVREQKVATKDLQSSKQTVQEIAQATTEEFCKNLGIEGTFVIEEVEDGVQVELDTKDSGAVIGYHGEVLEALQLLLSLAISKKTGVFVRTAVEVGDYRKNRTAWLEHLAASARERALAEGSEITLSNLKPWERRIIHLYLEKDEEVLSESIGEGRNRSLVVKPRIENA